MQLPNSFTSSLWLWRLWLTQKVNVVTSRIPFVGVHCKLLFRDSKALCQVSSCFILKSGVPLCFTCVLLLPYISYIKDVVPSSPCLIVLPLYVGSPAIFLCFPGNVLTKTNQNSLDKQELKKINRCMCLVRLQFGVMLAVVTAWRPCDK